MSNALFYVVCAILSVLVLVGISLLSKVKTSVAGNLLSMATILCAVAITLVQARSNITWGVFCLVTATVAGLIWAQKVKMIQMPETVGLLNGIGGLASAIVGCIELVRSDITVFAGVTAALAAAVGTLTFTGSLVASGKLAKVLKPTPVTFPGASFVCTSLLIITAASVGSYALGVNRYGILVISVLASAIFGLVFALRVGGADMPITISLLNSLSGVAGSIAGMALYNILLVAIGGIVGASGLLLTQIMCRAMNRNLTEILLGKTTVASAAAPAVQNTASDAKEEERKKAAQIESNMNSDLSYVKNAKNVIIVPGYGMALAQAQFLVKELSDKLTANGATVKFAIHPVAGRMPGHMNVLLCEADLPYEMLFELDAINDQFAGSDLVVVVGANDVLNPAAREAADTPIYGMPILNVDKAPRVIICNYDLKPGYAGIENRIYSRSQGVQLLLGDAKTSLKKIIDALA